MNSEKDFKDALKNKLNEKQFQFDETAWEQAAQMLDATREEKKRRPFPYFLVSGILLFVSLIGFYILKPTETVKEISSTNTVTEKVTIKNNETINAEVKEIPAEKIITNSALTEKIVSNDSKKEIEKTVTVNTEKKISTKENVSETKTKNTSAKNKKVKKERKTTANNVIAITSKKEESNTAVNVKTQTPKQNETGVKENIGMKAEETIVKEIITTPVEEIKADELIATISILPVNTSPVKEPVAFIELPKTDELPKNSIKEPVHFISFEAGASYLLGWNNPGKKDADGINPIVGLNYSNTLNTPFVFSIGLHYTTVRNLSYSNHVVTTTRYNFGEETDVMVFTPTTMHYLLAPIKFGYTYKEKNVFGIGYNAAYLFNLNSNVELYSENGGQKGNATILKTSGYTQGFKTIESQASLFYRRKLGKDLWLNTEFIYGLTDIKDDKFFNSNVFERNMGLKITLIYNLFKK